MKKLLFIYNPRSGTGRITRYLSGILDTFVKAGYLVTVHPTQHRRDAAETAAAMGAAFDRVVCSGGDGTLSETVSGLMRLPADLRPELAFIPAGSTNDCARNLHIPQGMEAAAQVACAGFPCKIDIGRLNSKPFVYVAAFGTFTDVAYATPQDLKRMFGHLAYLLAAINALPTLTHYPLRIEHDGGVIEDDFLVGIVSNSLSVGGVETLPPSQVKLDDGLFEVILLKTMDNVLQVGEALQSAISRKPVAGGKLLVLHTSKLKIISKGGVPIPWTIDGEFGGEYVTSELVNCTRCITAIQGKASREPEAPPALP